jgi:hypothetical protein
MDADSPLFFTERQFETVRHVAEVLIPEGGRAISANLVARRVDALLAQAKPPSARDIRLAVTLLEFVFPLMILTPVPFSRAPLSSQRKLLEKIIAGRGRLRSLARMLKTLVAFCYYTHPIVRRTIGYVDFEERPRFALLDTTPTYYALPTLDAHEIR